jgi:hypothetical protein
VLADTCAPTPGVQHSQVIHRFTAQDERECRARRNNGSRRPMFRVRHSLTPTPSVRDDRGKLRGSDSEMGKNSVMPRGIGMTESQP